MFSQLGFVGANQCELCYVPVIFPSISLQNSVGKLGNRVSYKMCNALAQQEML